MGMLGGGNGGRQARLGDHVQPMNLRRMFRHRRMMHRQIVDEGRSARVMAVNQRPCRNAFAALVADDLVRDAMAGEMLDPPRMRQLGDVGEDDDVGNLADPSERLNRAGHQCLAMHFILEEFAKQRPHPVASQGLARAAIAQCPVELAGLEREIDIVRLGQIKFESMDALAAQMAEDGAVARRQLGVR